MTRNDVHRRTVGLSLRSRVAVAFCAASVAVAGVVAVVVWQLTSTYMFDQREQSASLQASANLAIIEDSLDDGAEGVTDLLNGAASDPGATAMLRTSNGWRVGGRQIRPSSLPPALLAAVDSGTRSWQRLEVDDVPVLAVVIPGSDHAITYVQLFPLSELTRIYRFLILVLVGGAAGSGVIGAVIGYWTSRRALRPLTELTRSAALVAAGDLTVRLPEQDDPDLAPLASTFNDTVASLEQRVRQDERFAGDVSHELRSPLTTMVNAVELLQHRRAELPPTSGQAVDLLAEEIERFQRMVVDLLEISRPNTDVDVRELELIDLAVLVRNVGGHGYGIEPIVVRQPPLVLGDRRRLVRIVANLLDNARHHAGGADAVTVTERGGRARLEVEDHGPGVPPELRDQIFLRFARGERGERTGSHGTGLGLALVAQHVQLHSGDVWVEDRPGGGARFVVELPAASVDATGPYGSET